MRTVVDGNVSALLGTAARFSFTFDKPIKTAVFVLAPLHGPANADASEGVERIPLAMATVPGGEAMRVGVIDLTVNQDRQYSIEAEATDGTLLKPNRYRIRVRNRPAPQVSFESPSEGVEVHSLAELPMRVRVNDDYGLTKAGVIFQVNNEQEIPLLAEDFAAVVDAAKEVAEIGSLSPKTQATLERLLPLEFFALTQKDSIMYFAFAEDNLPGSPHAPKPTCGSSISGRSSGSFRFPIRTRTTAAWVWAVRA